MNMIESWCRPNTLQQRMRRRRTTQDGSTDSACSLSFVSIVILLRKKMMQLIPQGFNNLHPTRPIEEKIRFEFQIPYDR
jgi:hypothetical protein